MMVKDRVVETLFKTDSSSLMRSSLVPSLAARALFET
jgi:hypothetical protein